jgi:phosphoglycolate phosphatase
MPISAVLFDFDGTLADSFGAITDSTNFTRASYGLPPLPHAQVRTYVGYGLSQLMRDLVPGAPVDESVSRYREHHERTMEGATKLLPGVGETVPELARRGYKLAVCSNKRVEFTRRLVAALGLAPHFAHVLGPDDVQQRAKPDPAMVLEGLTRLSVSANESVYIGDMVVDVQTARAANVPVWLVPPDTDAPPAEAPVEGARPDRVLRSFAELLELLPVRD